MLRKNALWHDPRVQSLKPVLRAYILSYAASTGPRLFGWLRLLRRRDLTNETKFQLLLTILKTSTQLNRFPAACAILVAGPTVVTRLVRTILLETIRMVGSRLPGQVVTHLLRHLRFLCTFLSACVAFDLLNRDKEWSRKRARSRGVRDFQEMKYESPNKHHLPPPGYRPQFAGKTIDFTLFALVRALDVLVISAWTRTRSSSRHPEKTIPRISSLAKRLADPSVFATSTAIIMWSWFYSPERLPRAYNKWISTAASIDSRLITALRRCRTNEFIYGQETGQTPLLTSLCDELGLPQQWGDPTQTIPIPCELYHCGTGKSCEIHALTRFLRAFKFSMALYLPLQFLSKLLTTGSSNSNLRAKLTSALTSATRSSTFLATFISTFYYAVCLVRTRLAPLLLSLFPNQNSTFLPTITRQSIDSGLCTLAGCLACGWSILLEVPNRRQEIAFFVAPKALGALLPGSGRVYEKKWQGLERWVFAGSVAVVLEGFARQGMRGEKGGVVRGVLGRVLNGVLKERGA